jgi:putative SOS response-associated peptidase YedK
MCGRFRLSKRKQLIEDYFDVANEVDWEPRFNIAPSQNVCIVRQNSTRPEREFSQARLGLIPSWAQDASIGHKMINAVETVADKPALYAGAVVLVVLSATLSIYLVAGGIAVILA